MLLRRQQEKKAKKSYTKSQAGHISAVWRADPFGPISTKIGRVVGVDDVIIQSNFCFNIFRGLRSTGGQNFRFPIDFAGHRYNSAAATAQPVITCSSDAAVAIAALWTAKYTHSKHINTDIKHNKIWNTVKMLYFTQTYRYYEIFRHLGLKNRGRQSA